MYQKMYSILFNAMTDALDAMEKQDYGRAAALLREAQRRTEELYMDSAEKAPS